MYNIYVYLIYKQFRRVKYSASKSQRTWRARADQGEAGEWCIRLATCPVSVTQIDFNKTKNMLPICLNICRMRNIYLIIIYVFVGPMQYNAVIHFVCMLLVVTFFFLLSVARARATHYDETMALSCWFHLQNADWLVWYGYLSIKTHTIQNNTKMKRSITKIPPLYTYKLNYRT